MYSIFTPSLNGSCYARPERFVRRFRPTALRNVPPTVPPVAAPRSPKLMDQVEALRRRNDSLCTEEAYWHWIKRFICFHDRRHPRELGPQEVEAFLTHLAVDANVAAVNPRRLP